MRNTIQLIVGIFVFKMVSDRKVSQYGNTFEVCTDNNPLTYVLSSAKLDATGHRWLAALSSFDFKLTYRSGRSNGDADGLSRRPQETMEMFPDVVKAISQAYLVSRD